MDNKKEMEGKIGKILASLVGEYLDFDIAVDDPDIIEATSEIIKIFIDYLESKQKINLMLSDYTK